VVKTQSELCFSMRIADFSFSNGVSVVRQNAKFFLIMSLAFGAAGFLGAGILTHALYSSGAEIRVLYGAAGSVGGRNSDRAVLLVRERMTQDSLERVIVDNGLYLQERQTGSLAEALKAIKQHLSTTVVSEDVVRLAFQANDPRLAQQVATQLLSQYGDDNGHQVRTQQDHTMQALSDEIKTAEADLIKQEENVKDFNLRLGGNLEKQAVTVATLNRLILQLQSNADLLATLQEQKSSQEKLLGQQPESQSGRPISEIQLRIDQLNQEIEHLRGQQSEIRKQMAPYQARIDSAPKVKALQKVVSDHESAKRRYQGLLAKRNEMERARNEKKLSGSRFQVVSPATFSDTPSNGQSLFMVRLAGLLSGLLVSIGLVASRSRRVGQKASLDEVVRQSGLPVLASIPWIPLGTGRPSSHTSDPAALHQSSTSTT
jgi:uncharacterized protein involved in exopolysaccharide biosynthesis